MKNMKKIIVVALAVAMLAVAAVAGTLAWLHDNEIVSGNVATYGEVDISLKADVYDDLHLLPNCTYVMNPTVSVIAPSETGEVNEEAYIRAFVVITDAYDLMSVLKPADKALNGAGEEIFLLQNHVNGTWDDTKWAAYAVDYVEGATDAEDYLVYEFRYIGKSSTGTDGNERVGVVPAGFVGDLEVLFQSFTLPKYLNNDQVEKIYEMGLTFEAQAVQATNTEVYEMVGGVLTTTTVYFESADAAWAEFDSQIGTPISNPNLDDGGARATLTTAIVTP